MIFGSIPIERAEGAHRQRLAPRFLHHVRPQYVKGCAVIAAADSLDLRWGAALDILQHRRAVPRRTARNRLGGGQRVRVRQVNTPCLGHGSSLKSKGLHQQVRRWAHKQLAVQHT